MKHWFTQAVSKLSRATSTGWGSETSWATGATVEAIMGRINLISGNERYTNDRVGLDASHKFFCSATESISITDRLKYSGTTYGVVFVKDTLGLGHHKTVYLKEPV